MPTTEEKLESTPEAQKSDADNVAVAETNHAPVNTLRALGLKNATEAVGLSKAFHWKSKAVKL